MRHSSRQQQGAVLLLSVLILFGLTAVAGGVAALIFSNLRSNQNVDSSITAYYSAEGGLEKALNIIKTNRTWGQCNASGKQCRGDSDCDVGSSETCNFRSMAMTEADATMTSGAAQVTTTPVIKDKIEYLPPDQAVQINLYNPDDLTLPGLGIDTLKIFAPATGNNGRLEVSWTGWIDSGVGQKYFYEGLVKKVLSPSEYSTAPDGYAINLQTEPNSNPRMYAFQVTIKAILSDVSNIEIKAFNGNTLVANWYSRLSVKAIGTAGSVQTALTAEVPWRLPTSGLLDYVLFSEETIKKEG